MQPLFSSETELVAIVCNNMYCYIYNSNYYSTKNTALKENIFVPPFDHNQFLDVYIFKRFVSQMEGLYCNFARLSTSTYEMSNCYNSSLDAKRNTNLVLHVVKKPPQYQTSYPTVSSVT
jgi:hypothetical protein